MSLFRNISPNPPNRVVRALERDLTRMGKGPSRRMSGGMAPVVDLLSVRGGVHKVAAGSRALSLADSCGASWRDLRLAGG